MLRVQAIVFRKIVFRNHSFNRFSKNGDISRRLRQYPVQAKGHMSFKNSHFSEPFLRPLAELIVGPSKEARIDGINSKWIIFPLDYAIQCRPSALRQMEIE